VQLQLQAHPASCKIAPGKRRLCMRILALRALRAGREVAEQRNPDAGYDMDSTEPTKPGNKQFLERKILIA